MVSGTANNAQRANNGGEMSPSDEMHEWSERGIESVAESVMDKEFGKVETAIQYSMTLTRHALEDFSDKIDKLIEISSANTQWGKDHERVHAAQATEKSTIKYHRLIIAGIVVSLVGVTVSIVIGLMGLQTKQAQAAARNDVPSVVAPQTEEK
jgi:hypothetical protein